ncbi:MAG: ankyrin repeat domain-containing protein [Planctomycetes bacterium]|nr:ankyrin repeat domain-containing protein [Planctomycetota bacterium]MBL7147003.1 ankyrin repeat domain-containing protein [Phycisphaerae bacterium]
MKHLIISLLVVFLFTSFSSIAMSAGLNQITDVLTVQKELVNPDSEDTTAAKTNYVAELNKIGIAGRPESDNAAPYYQKAIELFVKQPDDLEVSTRSWPKDQPAQQHAMLKKWVQDNSRALEQLQLAGQKSYYWQKQTGEKMQLTEMPHLSTMRQLAFALQNRAMLSAEDGNITSALSDIETLYTIGAQMSVGPKPLVEKLVGIAVKSLPIRVVLKMLDRKMLDNNSLKTLEDRFKQLVAASREPMDLRGEKIYLQEQVETDPQYSVFKPYLKKTLEQYDTMASKNPMELHNEQTQPTNETDPLAALAPPFAKINEIEYRIRTDEDALITTLALLRYNAGSDSYPRELQQLVSAGYIKEVPKDPFSDNPLVYKQTRDGFTLYSFGADFDDDGGQHSRWGAGDEGGDQVFWPVEQTQTAQAQPRRGREGGPYGRRGSEDEQRNVTTQESDTSDVTLHDAVRNGDINQVQSLLSQGADVNLKNRMSWTPLHTAVQNRRQEIVELLVTKGADLNATNNRQQTPLYVAVNNSQKEIVELLISKGADVNIMASGDNALTIAQKRRNTEIIDILVKNGATEPSPQDLMGDRYYQGGDNLYSSPQVQANTSSRNTRGSRAAIQPVEVDILADPNEIKARIKTFAGLQKALDDLDAKSKSETRQWEQTRTDNRTTLVRYVQKQFEEEINLIRTVSVSEKAQKTTEAIDSALSLRQERFKATSKELMTQRREQMQSQQTSTRTRGRSRTSTRSARGMGSQNEQQYDSSDSYGRNSSDPYGRGNTTGRSAATRQPSQQPAQPVDREAENESRQWLQASFEDKSDLAEAVNEQIEIEVTSIRDVAVEEAAKKTTAAIDGLLLARQMRLNAFFVKMEQLQQTQQQAQDPRTQGGYQQGTRSSRGATRGGTTGGYQQGSQSGTRRRR